MKLKTFTCFYILTISTLGTPDKTRGNIKTIIATKGEDIRLKCEVDRSKLSEDLVWKTGAIVIASGNVMSLKSHRFQTDIVSSTLIVYNATTRDNREFSCSDTSKTYTIFNVTIQELFCKDVDDLPNGHIQYSAESGQNGYKQGTQLTYKCNSGYMLIGGKTRDCDDPSRKWSGTRAICKDLHIINLEQKIEKQQEEINNLSKELKKVNSKDKILEKELNHQYSLWEYLLYDLSSYKKHTKDVTDKLEIENNNFHALLRRQALRHSGRRFGQRTKHN